MPPGEAGTTAAINTYVQQPFGVFAELFALQASAVPHKIALICGDDRLTYRQLDDLADRIAARLQHEGVARGRTVAICAGMSNAYVAVMLGVLRTGAPFVPLSPSSTADQLVSMLRDSAADILFLDAVGVAALGAAASTIAAHCIAMDDGAGGEALRTWLPPEGTRPGTGRDLTRSTLQHYLFFGHDGYAEGYRSAACHALAAASVEGPTRLRA